ncbi:MAG: hypothetical protein Q8Q33_07185 [Chlamydiota bacterium]|nr:hypothetical protein [Chlamydiota bacterium]
MKKFSLGLIVGVLIGVYFGPTLQRILPNQAFNAQGTVQYSPVPDMTASATLPEGYYIEIQTLLYLDRFDPRFQGKSIFVQGPLSVKCGPDGYPCFPQIRVKNIREAKID